jgi:DNA polymerase-3 subunit gamma/tau
MSYQVLARRWRPQTFDEVVGQQHVTVTLRNALKSERLPHAILLAGPRGVGKTSIARILAKCLNCDEGPTEKPCGQCAPCQEIGASRSMDVQEIDAASHTGVENVREIRESIRYTAAPGKHRIFIIDEVHMLSQAAFNALLKTLEEPPPRSLFIFATTDPRKIPQTVLSRVQWFDLKRLGPVELLARLREIAGSESIDLPEGVLRALVREADGSLRDALTLVDRLVSGLGPSIREDDAIAILDLIDRRILRDILEPVLAHDPGEALRAVRRALEKGIDPARLAGSLLEEIRNLAVARLVDDPSELIDAAPDEVEEIRSRAQGQDPEALDRLFRVLQSRTQELAFAQHPDHVVEMAVVRMAVLPASESIADLLRRLEGLGSGPPLEPGGPARPPEGPAGSPGGFGGRMGSSPRPSKGSARRPGASAQSANPRDPAGEGGARRRPDREKLSRIRQETKSHPAVRRVIDFFDAELQSIEFPKEES